MIEKQSSRKPLNTVPYSGTVSTAPIISRSAGTVVAPAVLHLKLHDLIGRLKASG